ncbi:hypothetical protein QO012_004034 [Methylobacterium aerolatum]|uniref:Uncharacterized protein n=1 Tax=Methylobacterium aerolatum TaxID=418708 RepID=A0ABU0I6K4_9HYPH|nr:hypothetical protein [Methylobacterium aerolatum]GJD33545.1 hypothetical protein FMGBMHLM_0435 [Methylobacterium aerolatum]
MWIAYGPGALVPAPGVVLYVYDHIVRPSRIPREEIEALAAAMERSRPDDPDDGAFVEEQAARFRSDPYARVAGAGCGRRSGRAGFSARRRPRCG